MRLRLVMVILAGGASIACSTAEPTADPAPGADLELSGGDTEDGGEPGTTSEAPPRYDDGKKNGNETDVDCGRLVNDPATLAANSKDSLDRKPLNCAPWHVLEALCIWDGGRLPTLVEWTFAAQGGEAQRSFPWGNTQVAHALPPRVGAPVPRARPRPERPRASYMNLSYTDYYVREALKYPIGRSYAEAGARCARPLSR